MVVHVVQWLTKESPERGVRYHQEKKSEGERKGAGAWEHTFGMILTQNELPISSKDGVGA